MVRVCLVTFARRGCLDTMEVARPAEIVVEPNPNEVEVEFEVPFCAHDAARGRPAVEYQNM